MRINLRVVDSYKSLLVYQFYSTVFVWVMRVLNKEYEIKKYKALYDAIEIYKRDVLGISFTFYATVCKHDKLYTTNATNKTSLLTYQLDFHGI